MFPLLLCSSALHLRETGVQVPKLMTELAYGPLKAFSPASLNPRRLLSLPSLLLYGSSSCPISLINFFLAPLKAGPII